MYKSCSENLKICAQCAVHEVSKFCKGPDFTVYIKMSVWDREFLCSPPLAIVGIPTAVGEANDSCCIDRSVAHCSCTMYPSASSRHRIAHREPYFRIVTDSQSTENISSFHAYARKNNMWILDISGIPDIGYQIESSLCRRTKRCVARMAAFRDHAMRAFKSSENSGSPEQPASS